MAEKIRAGLVGATVSQSGSQWGARAHVPALKSLPEYEIAAVCTAHEDTAKASAAAFGAAKAYWDFAQMAADPDLDLIVVSVKVPSHFDLVMGALRGGKQVYCEWPLGANLAEAESMSNLARERGLKTAVGLQGRSDPGLRYARELVEQGYVGEVIAVNMTVSSQAQTQRSADRIWQAERKAGANPLTIPGGHSIDALCFVLGEFSEVSARVVTKMKEWRSTETNQAVPVTAPDTISIAGVLSSGAEVSAQVLTVPSNAGGFRMDIYGSDGALTVTTPGSANIGPNLVYGCKGREASAAMPVPERLKMAPEGTPAGQAYNVAQAYTRLADTLRDQAPFDPDFELAVQRHRMIDAMERSSAEGRAVKL
jgi:predicted dehydrogenase